MKDERGTSSSFKLVQSRDNGTILHSAIEKGNIQIVKELLKTPNIDINATDSLGRTALHRAMRLGGDDIVAELLKTPNIDVNTIDHTGNTALHRAAQKGLWNYVQLILAMPNRKVDLTNDDGETALNCAARTGVQTGYDLLLPLLDKDLKNKTGFTAVVLFKEASEKLALKEKSDNRLNAWRAEADRMKRLRS